MAEKITVAELDIDTDAFIAQAQQTKAAIVAIKEEQKSLKKSGNESSQQFVQNEARLKALGTQYTRQKNVLAELSETSTRFKSVQQQLTDATDKEITSIAGARDNNRELLKIRNELNLSTEQGQAQLVSINEKLDKNNGFIKENVSQYEQQKIGIGDYSTAIQDALGKTTLFGGQLQSVKQFLGIFGGAFTLVKQEAAGAASQIKNAAVGTEGLTKAQKAAAVSSNVLSGALRILKLALISTGIGAIVVALGSLITFLGTTQKGIDAVTKVTKPLEVIFSKLVGVIQEFGEGLFEALSNPKQLIIDLGNLIKNNVINRFEALASIIDKVLSFEFEGIGEDISKAVTGVEDLSGKLGDLATQTTNFLKDGVDVGLQLRQIAIDIEQKEAEIVLRRAELNQQIKEQELIAKNTQLSAEARNKATERAVELSKELKNEEIGLLNLKIQQEEIEQSLNDSGREDEKALNELKAERIAQQEQADARELRFLGARNSARKQQETERLQAIKAQQDAAREASQENIEALQLELDIYRENNATKLESDARLNDAIVEASIQTRTFIRDEQLRILQQQVEDELITQREADLKKLQINREFEEQRDELQNEFKEQRKEVADAEREAEIELQRTKLESEIERQLFELDLKKQNEIAAAEEIGASTADITAKYAILETEILKKEADRQERIDELKQKAKLDAASNVFGQIASLFGEQTAIAKVAAIAQATIDTYKGANLALGTLPPPFGAIAATLTVASGLANVSKIAGVAAFNQGGLINDGVIIPEHMRNSGGDDVLIQAKRGEVILNEQQQQRAGGANFLRSIGVPSFNTGGIVGGTPSTTQIQNNIQQQGIDYEKLSMAFAMGASRVKTVVAVEDINNGQGRVAEVEQMANI